MTLSELFLTLLNRSLAAAWLVLAILLLRPFLRRVSRSVCCALWGLVAFRLLCPFSVQSILSLLPSAEPIPTNLAELHAPDIDGNTILNQTGGEFVTPVVDAPSASPVQTVLLVLSVLWLVGFSLFVLYAVISYLQVRKRVWDAVRQEDGVWGCARIKYPFVLGVFRPRIYVPFSVNESDLPYILAHERAHLARRDHWRKPIAFVLLAVFWFQPVMWIAYFLLSRDIEFACDERAIRAMGVELESKKLYATALLRSNPTRASMPKLYCPLAFGGLQVKRRVNSVLTYKKPAAVRMLAALLVCAAVAVCFLTDPKVGAGEPMDSLVSAATNHTTSTADKPSKEELMHPPAEPSEMTHTETKRPDAAAAQDPNRIGKKSDNKTWYISDVFQQFVVGQGYDPTYILQWAIRRSEMKNENEDGRIKLIIDIDLDVYLETGKMIQVENVYWETYNARLKRN